MMKEYQKIRNMDVLSEEAVGHIGEYRGVFFSGESQNIDTGVFRTLWPLAQPYKHPTSAQNCTVVSDDVNDTDGGTGANTMLLTVLDSEYEEFIIAITLNGTTPVALPFPIFALNGAVVLTHGTSNYNEGTITFQSTDDPGVVFGVIKPEESNLLQAIQTVPKGETWVAKSFFASAKLADSVRMRAVAHSPSGLQQVVTANYVTAAYPFINTIGVGFPETFTVEVDAESLVSVNQECSVIVQFRAYRNEHI